VNQAKDGIKNIKSIFGLIIVLFNIYNYFRPLNLKQKQ
jgi:hypothetical protein